MQDKDLVDESPRELDKRMQGVQASGYRQGYDFLSYEQKFGMSMFLESQSKFTKIRNTPDMYKSKHHSAQEEAHKMPNGRFGIHRSNSQFSQAFV
jgi:hypothetical protein